MAGPKRKRSGGGSDNKRLKNQGTEDHSEKVPDDIRSQPHFQKFDDWLVQCVLSHGSLDAYLVEQLRDKD